MIERSLITATVASYRPMLMNIAEVIFGNCAAVFQRDAAGHETHVDRTLNVMGSGFQHERYFDQMEEAILAVFNREPYEDQPRYVADMGCGDGTLLRKIYDLIKAKSLRGKVLDRYPVKLIGVDYNAQALEATARTLAGYESPRPTRRYRRSCPADRRPQSSGHSRPRTHPTRAFLSGSRPALQTAAGPCCCTGSCPSGLPWRLCRPRGQQSASRCSGAESGGTPPRLVVHHWPPRLDDAGGPLFRAQDDRQVHAPV